MTVGEFPAAARAAILEAGGGRCVGCGRPNPETQHRRARGMGGTSSADVGQAVNGVPLCGPNPRGCHGWAEANPAAARLLGWALRGLDDYAAPWWSRYGWRRWVLEDLDALELEQLTAPVPLVAFVDDTDLDQRVAREVAVDEYRRWRAQEDDRVGVEC